MLQPSSGIIRQLLADWDYLSGSDLQEQLLSLDDKELWYLFQKEKEAALGILYKRHYQYILIRLYKRSNDWTKVSLEEAQEVFAEFMERVLNGKFKGTDLKKNFPAFAIYYSTFLLRSRRKQTNRYPIVAFENDTHTKELYAHHLHIEKKLDWQKVIDCIPKLSNKLYRKIVYLVLVMGYNSKDFIPVFGKRAMAYDKKYRAMEAFKKILKEDGIWQELNP